MLSRPSCTEAAVDLTRLAGLLPGAAISAIVNEDPAGFSEHDLAAFSFQHHLRQITIAELVDFWRGAGRDVEHGPGAPEALR